MSDRVVFRADAPDAPDAPDARDARGRYVLRGCPASDADLARLRSQLEWQRAIVRETGLGVPDPVRSSVGDFVVPRRWGDTDEVWCWSLVRWVDGRPFNRPYGEARLERVGTFVARLHVQAAQWVPPADFQPSAVEDDDTALRFVRGGASILRELDELPPAERELVGPSDRALLSRLEEQLRGRLSSVPVDRESVGLVHDDLHALNLLFHGLEVRAIDFDGATVDYFANDLAVSLGEGVAGVPGGAAFPAKRRALVRGYARVRTPPRGDVLDALLTLKLARSVPRLARWTRHTRIGIAIWARAQLRGRLDWLRGAA